MPTAWACLTACSLNSAVYSCFGIFFTSLPSGLDPNHRPLEDEKRLAAHYISQLERGERNATLSKVDELASVMGLHPAKLVTLSYLPSPGSTADLDKLLLRVREEVIRLSAKECT